LKLVERLVIEDPPTSEGNCAPIGQTQPMRPTAVRITRAPSDSTITERFGTSG
jgi:hypothetical protein